MNPVLFWLTITLWVIFFGVALLGYLSANQKTASDWITASIWLFILALIVSICLACNWEDNNKRVKPESVAVQVGIV